MNYFWPKALLLFFICTFGAYAKQSDCKLSVRTEFSQQNFLPLNYSINKLAIQSYALLNDVVKRSACTLEQISLPNARAVKMLKDGELAVMVGMSKTSEREQHFYFLGPYHTERIVAVGSNGLQKKIKNLTQLMEHDGLISVTRGAYYGAQWQTALQNNPNVSNRLIQLSENQKNLSLLMLNRVAISFEDEQVVDELMQLDNFKDRFMKLFTLHENFVYFAFSKKLVSQSLFNKIEKQWKIMHPEQYNEQFLIHH